MPIRENSEIRRRVAQAATSTCQLDRSVPSSSPHHLHGSPASAMRAACRRLAEAATEAGARRGDPYSWRNGREPSSTATRLLAGRLIAIKENISFRQAPTTCSSQILDGQSIHYTMHVNAAEDVIE